MKQQDKVAVPVRAANRPPSFTDQLIEPLSRLRTEVDRLFDSFPFHLPASQFGKTFATLNVPAVEMTETKRTYKITVELPGIEPDDVEVSCDDRLLRISGQKTEEREEDERGYRLAERSYGAFERVIELPSAADDQKIKAKFKNGVLTVSVPKDGKAAPQARRIAVEKA